MFRATVQYFAICTSTEHEVEDPLFRRPSTTYSSTVLRGALHYSTQVKQVSAAVLMC